MRRICTILFALLFATVLLAQGAVPKQSLRFGIRVSPPAWSDLAPALATEPCDPANPVGVTLVLPGDWAKAPDWTAFDSAAKGVLDAHGRLIVSTQLPGGPGEPGTLAYLTAVSAHAAGADTLVLSLQKEQFSDPSASDPDRLALTLKQLTTALRGNSQAAVLIGEAAEAFLPVMKPLYDRDFRAYVDGYSSYEAGSLGEPDETVVHFFEENHLGAPFLLHLPRVESPIAAQLTVLLSASQGISFSDVEPASVAPVWHALVLLRARLTPAMAEGFSVQATEISDPSGRRGDVAILNYLDSDQMVQAMALVPTMAKSPSAELRVKLPTGDVTDPVAYTLPDGAKLELGYTADQKKGETVLRVPWQGKALLVLFSRLKTGVVGQGQVSVSAAYKIPVEIILARHQAVQQPQDILLHNYTAKAQVDYHFKLPGGTGSLDVTFLNDFFYRRGEGARWVQNQMLLNGVAWKGGTIPNLPIIEPAKVNTLPLALTLGRDYTYRYIRDEVIDGRDCFVVEFVPAPGAKGSLYSGKVWIDKETYVRKRMSVRQSGLEPPTVSNDETDYYTPVQGPDGRTFYLLTRLSGQMIFSVAGANVAADREIRFSDVELNAPEFSAEVKRAEESSKPILQDTEKGLRYLVKEKDGSRKLQMDPATGKWFAVAGTYYDQSLDYPLPLVGVNYFDYDFKKSKTQVNMFVTGVVNTLTVAKVDLLPKVDADANALLFAIPFEDKVYPTGKEDKALGVKVLREYVNGSLGWRFTEFSKLFLELGAMYYRYSKASETSYLFRMPSNHFDLDADLGYRYSRRGWSLAADYDAHHRSAWEPWGMPGTNEDWAQKNNYALWNVSASKSFYLPNFQKITASATWMDGRDLDRFSQYQFSYLGRDSLVGFAGSGVRFDRGGVARIAYAFNVANVVRFGLNVDQARVQPVKGVDLWQNHTGVGLSGAVTGPWKTYWTLDLGYALRSDIPDVRHDYTAALVVLKLW